jgi:hypothetical protein
MIRDIGERASKVPADTAYDAMRKIAIQYYVDVLEIGRSAAEERRERAMKSLQRFQ